MESPRRFQIQPSSQSSNLPLFQPPNHPTSQSPRLPTSKSPKLPIPLPPNPSQPRIFDESCSIDEGSEEILRFISCNIGLSRDSKKTQQSWTPTRLLCLHLLCLLFLLHYFMTWHSGKMGFAYRNTRSNLPWINSDEECPVSANLRLNASLSLLEYPEVGGTWMISEFATVFVWAYYNTRRLMVPGWLLIKTAPWTFYNRLRFLWSFNTRRLVVPGW